MRIPSNTMLYTDCYRQCSCILTPWSICVCVCDSIMCVDFVYAMPYGSVQYNEL